MRSNTKLKTENIAEQEKVPPGLFLTLLENGLTHNQITGEKATFVLQFQKEKPP